MLHVGEGRREGGEGGCFCTNECVCVCVCVLSSCGENKNGSKVLRECKSSDASSSVKGTKASEICSKLP